MKRKLFTWLLAASTGMLTAAQAAQLRADEVSSPLYEDDAWYDVTEWFDGNDYNPTDEQFFKWDNETYEAAAAANSTDRDTDNARYGFDDSTTTDDNWYYDYDYNDYDTYSDYDSNGSYEFSSQYYDYDNDGYYDAYSSYFDSDGDGIYEDYAYVSFADAGNNSQKADQTKKDASANASKRNAKMYAVDGKIESTKQIEGLGGKRLMAHVTRNGQKFVVDLGSPDQFNTNLTQGDQITARGAISQVGDKLVLLAKEVEYQGQSEQIDRSPRRLSGKIVDTMTAKPRSDQQVQHTLVKMETEDQKHALVDLGPADRLDADLNKGQQIEVSGVAVKMKERPVLFASKLSVDGNDISIDRHGHKDGMNGSGSNREARRQSEQTSQK